MTVIIVTSIVLVLYLVYGGVVSVAHVMSAFHKEGSTLAKVSHYLFKHTTHTHSYITTLAFLFVLAGIYVEVVITGGV